MAGVVADLRALDVDVIVVDDGSADDTGARAHDAGASVVTLPTNLGIGGALQTGFRLARQRNYEVAFQFDADGQHSTDYVPGLLAPVLAGEADMVIGSRFASGSDEYQVGHSRRLLMRLLARLVSHLAGMPLSDVSSGFRAFGPRAIELFADEYPQDYMESVEALVIAARAGLKIRETSVTMYERAWGEPSNRSLRAVTKVVRMLLSVLLIRMRPVRRPSWES